MEQHPDPRASSDFSRRQLLGGAAALAGASFLGARPAAARQAARPVLVQVFLRGAMDGLTAVVPHGDPGYYAARPSVAVPPPGAASGALDLDGFFGLAPAAAPLLLPYANGCLAFVHAVGTPATTRSHGLAFRHVELGDPDLPPGALSDSWIARLLAATSTGSTGPLRALGSSHVRPLSLLGAERALSVPLPASLAFPGAPSTAGLRAGLLAQAYGLAPAPLGAAGLDALAGVALLSQIDFAGYVPANGAVYPASAFGAQMRAVAALVRADVGVEVITLDHHGWDLHAALGPLSGSMAWQLDDLARSLRALYLDLAPILDRVLVVCLTEFGRRVDENSSLGLDHGDASAMLVLGGGVQGGQVVADWPGLAPAELADGGLAVTIDYRDVLGELLDRRLGVDPSEVFPQHAFTQHGIAV